MVKFLNLGRVVGLSAYEIAVSRGYSGTIDEWLDSLRYDHSDEFKNFRNDIAEALSRFTSDKKELDDNINAIRSAIVQGLKDIESNKTAAINEINTTGSDINSSIESTRNDSVRAVQNAGSNTLGDIEQSKSSAVSAIIAEKDAGTKSIKSLSVEKLKAIADSLEEALSNIDDSGTAWKQQVENRGQLAKQEIENVGRVTKQDVQSKADQVLQQFAQDAEAKTTEELAKINADEVVQDVSKLKTDVANIGEVIVQTVQPLQKQADRTEQKLDALWKLNKGQTYDFIEQEQESYSNEIPLGAKYVSVEKLGGKSLVWNQLCDNKRTARSASGMTANLNDGLYTISGTATANYSLDFATRDSVYPIIGHRYLYKLVSNDFNNIDGRWRIYPYINGAYVYTQESGAEWIAEARQDDALGLAILLYNECTINGNIKVKGELFDLTKIEESLGITINTVEEFNALFPNDYYSYQEPIIKNVDVDSVDVEGKNKLLVTKEKLEKTLNGVTFKVEDGIINASGIPTNNVNFDLFSGDIKNSYGGCSGISIDKFKNKKITISMTNDAFENAYLSLIVRKGNESVYSVTNISVPKTYDLSLYPDADNILVCIKRGVDAIPMLVKNAKVQLEIGEAQTPYSPYKHQSKPMQELVQKYFPNGMKSVGTVYDELDLENKQAIQRVGRTTFEKLNFGMATDYFYAVGLNDKAFGNKNIICAKFSTATTSANNMNEKEIKGNASNTNLYIKDSSYSLVSELYNDIKDEYLYYELAEPIITPLSDEDVEYLQDIECEAGGSITFTQSDMRLPIINKEEYIRKLDEVV